MSNRREILGAFVGMLSFAALASSSGSNAQQVGADEVGFFSKQRVLERLGAPGETADQRSGVSPTAAAEAAADIERRVQLAGNGAADPLSPAEVEGALDAAFAPLVAPVMPAVSDVAAIGLGKDRCSGVRSAQASGWGLLGKLNGQTFTWVDGVGKLRSMTYRLTNGGKEVVLSISLRRRLLPLDMYRRTRNGFARVSTTGSGRRGTLRLREDAFSFDAAHETGTYTLDARCDLVLEGSLRLTGRRIRDVFFNTTGGIDAVQEQAIRDRSASRIARLRGSAIIGLARHS